MDCGCEHRISSGSILTKRILKIAGAAKTLRQFSIIICQSTIALEIKASAEQPVQSNSATCAVNLFFHRYAMKKQYLRSGFRTGNPQFSFPLDKIDSSRACHRQKRDQRNAGIRRMREGGKPIWFAGRLFSRLPTVESVGFERGTAAAGTFAKQKYPVRLKF